jgi:hypothetical protein
MNVDVAEVVREGSDTSVGRKDDAAALSPSSSPFTHSTVSKSSQSASKASRTTSDGHRTYASLT